MATELQRQRGLSYVKRATIVSTAPLRACLPNIIRAQINTNCLHKLKVQAAIFPGHFIET